MIPKIIHYCWFGGNQKSTLANKCMKSWEKFCPDYEIKEWNENTFDVSCAPDYVKQAHANKKWAFVSDYVRLWALYNCGGIYMDTDVEIIRNLAPLLNHKAVSGFEHGNYIQTAFMASEQGLEIFDDLLHDYDSISFINHDGTFDTTPNVKRITDKLSTHGLEQNNRKQTVSQITFFPSDYFAPKDFITGIVRKTENTFIIHHYDGTWLKPEEFKERNRRWCEWRRKDIRERFFNKLKLSKR